MREGVADVQPGSAASRQPLARLYLRPAPHLLTLASLLGAASPPRSTMVSVLRASLWPQEMRLNVIEGPGGRTAVGSEGSWDLQVGEMGRSRG